MDKSGGKPKTNSNSNNASGFFPGGLTQSQAAALNARGMMDPAAALFAHSLFGGYSHMGSIPDPLGIFGQSSMNYGGAGLGRPPTSSPSTSTNQTPSSSASGMTPVTSQASSMANLSGQNAAWWSLAASQMAAQEYLQRLQFSQLAGMARGGNASEMMAAQEMLAAQYASLVAVSQASSRASSAPSSSHSVGTYLPPAYTSAGSAAKNSAVTLASSSTKTPKVSDRGFSTSKSNGTFKLPAETDVIRFTGKSPKRDPPPSALLGFRSSPYDKPREEVQPSLKRLHPEHRRMSAGEPEGGTEILNLKVRKQEEHADGILNLAVNKEKGDGGAPLNLSMKSSDCESPLPADFRAQTDAENLSMRSTPVKDPDYQGASPTPSSKRADTPSSTKSGFAYPTFSSTPSSNPLAALDALQQHLFMLQGTSISPFGKREVLPSQPQPAGFSRATITAKPLDKRVIELSSHKPATPQSRGSESTDDLHDSYGESEGESEEDHGNTGEVVRNDGGFEEPKQPRRRRRRKMILDEDLLRAPLEAGWKRETLIKGVGRNGIRGEVTYFAPCGRRFKQYPEVIRYLDRHKIKAVSFADISRNNFNFSTKPFIGDFLQPVGDVEDSQTLKLDEKDALSLVNQIRATQGMKPVSANLTHSDDTPEKVQRSREDVQQQKLEEAQEYARLAEESRQQEKLDKERALHIAREARRIEKEQQRITKLEMCRREREQKAMEYTSLEQLKFPESLLENALFLASARRKKVEVAEKMREEEQIKKVQELSRHKELLYAAELEKERRKQHSLWIRSLELRKKFDDREKRRQKKHEKLRQEWRALEDLALPDSKPLPKLPRIPGLKLPAKAFGDILMAFEFLHTFGTAIGFDVDSLPGLCTLQRAVTFHADSEDELVSIMTHLLVVAIDDPGIPFPMKNLTTLGQTLKQAEITTTNLTEILRLYLKAHVIPEKDFEQMSIRSQSVYNQFTSEECASLLELIGEKPFLALGPAAKAKALGFLINELTHNKRVVRQVENQSDVMNGARKDRWLMDNKIRGYKNLLTKMSRSSSLKMECGLEDMILSAPGIGPKREDLDPMSSDSETEMAENGAEEADLLDEEKALSPEELKTRIEKLGRQSASILALLSGSEKGLRALPIGQDRFRRRYWVLPHAGGVYVESMESSTDPVEFTFAGEDRPVVAPARLCDASESEEPSTGQNSILVKAELLDGVEVKEELGENTEIKSEVELFNDDDSTKISEIDLKVETKGDVAGPWFSLLPYVACDDDVEIMNGMQKEILKEIDVMRQDTSYLKDMAPVPESLLTGWWRITDPRDLKAVSQSLNVKGVRERDTHRTMSRFLSFAAESCSKGDPKLTSLVSEDSPIKPHKFKFMKSFDEGFDPGASNEEEPADFRARPSDDDETEYKKVEYFSREKALQVDLLILQQVEALEERIASASMQIKGWKLPPRASTEMSYRFRPSFQSPVDENDTTVSPVIIGRGRLLDLEASIEKRYLKPPFGLSKGEQLNQLINANGPGDVEMVSGSTYTIHAHNRTLNQWRTAVRSCVTSAQLAMYLYALEVAVCWDKSIMKACCQLCCCGDNEDQLLLCDSCDRGYHTYCFRPPMITIPEGDWYCVECVNKATSQKLCVVCRKEDTSGGVDYISCQLCPKIFHLGCHIPPLQSKPQKSRFACSFCQKNPTGSKRKRSILNASLSESATATSPNPSPLPAPSNVSMVSEPEKSEILERSELASESEPTELENSASSPATKGVKRKKKIKVDDALTPSGSAGQGEIRGLKKLLTALEKHQDSWPFALPVNTKALPQYKKIIKTPMDLSTIKKKLKIGQYKNRDDFYSDMILIFTNCETFNEDDSPVGKAGHSLRNFFELRWADMIA